jgi:hypothetical protein
LPINQKLEWLVERNTWRMTFKAVLFGARGEILPLYDKKKGLSTLEGCFLEKIGTKLSYFERNKGWNHQI